MWDMGEHSVSPALPGPQHSLLDCSLFSVSSAATGTSCLMQAVGGNRFVQIPAVHGVTQWLWELMCSYLGLVEDAIASEGHSSRLCMRGQLCLQPLTDPQKTHN